MKLDGKIKIIVRTAVTSLAAGLAIGIVSILVTRPGFESDSGFTSKTKVHHTGDHIISPALIDYLEGFRADWGIRGASVAVVRMKEDGEWEKETLGFGKKDAKGNAVTDKARSKPSFF
jgi:hypothetical protein